jgi:hypothetical protein
VNPLIFTLLSDGSSDRALLPVLRWLLRQHSSRIFQPQWADLRGLRNPPRSLTDRLQAAIELYPCDLLFVHRDAESERHEVRVDQIRQDLGAMPDQTAVCVVPVRMQEAWLLIDEGAVRQAADNPRGQVQLSMPPVEKIEKISDPKRELFDLLATASELSPRRLHRFRPMARIHRLAELVEDFSPLRRLPAFRHLEEDLRAVISQQTWD